MITKTTVADTLHDAGDRLHALARKIDPPELGVRIMWDGDYNIDGATSWGEPEDSDYAAETRAKLDSGEWIVVGVVAIERDRWTGEVRESDTRAGVWGVVTDASDAKGAPDTLFYDLRGRTDVFDLDDLSGYLREEAENIIAEARTP